MSKDAKSRITGVLSLRLQAEAREASGRVWTEDSSQDTGATADQENRKEGDNHKCAGEGKAKQRKNIDRRLTALEQTTQGRMTRNLNSTLSAIEDACSEGRIAEAALIVLDHLVRQVEKHKIIFDYSDAVVKRFLSQDPVLNGLSSSADGQLAEYWRTHAFPDLRREVGVERFDKVRFWKLLPPPSPPDPELGRLHRANKQPNLRDGDSAGSLTTEYFP